jgi:hypothetical protein
LAIRTFENIAPDDFIGGGERRCYTLLAPPALLAWSTIPAATVSLVASSIRMKLPVVRFHR